MFALLNYVLGHTLHSFCDDHDSSVDDFEGHVSDDKDDCFSGDTALVQVDMDTQADRQCGIGTAS